MAVSCYHLYQKPCHYPCLLLLALLLVMFNKQQIMENVFPRDASSLFSIITFLKQQACLFFFKVTDFLYSCLKFF